MSDKLQEFYNASYPILRKVDNVINKEDSVSMTSNIDTVRDKRLMVFTSLLRTLDFVGHERVDQCYGLFVEFEEQYPLIDGYTRTGKAVDHTNMKMFIKLYKEKLNEI